MSKTLYDVLSQLHETGYTLNDLLGALDEQLEQMRNNPDIRQDDGGRLISLTRTNLEVAQMYAEKYKKLKTGTGIPLIFTEEE